MPVALLPFPQTVGETVRRDPKVRCRWCGQITYTMKAARPDSHGSLEEGASRCRVPTLVPTRRVVSRKRTRRNPSRQVAIIPFVLLLLIMGGGRCDGALRMGRVPACRGIVPPPASYPLGAGAYFVHYLRGIDCC